MIQLHRKPLDYIFLNWTAHFVQITHSKYMPTYMLSKITLAYMLYHILQESLAWDRHEKQLGPWPDMKSSLSTT